MTTIAAIVGALLKNTWRAFPICLSRTQALKRHAKLPQRTLRPQPLSVPKR